MPLDVKPSYYLLQYRLAVDEALQLHSRLKSVGGEGSVLELLSRTLYEGIRNAILAEEVRSGIKDNSPLTPEEQLLLRTGKKLAAIQKVRERLHLGLVEAKNLVEQDF